MLAPQYAEDGAEFDITYGSGSVSGFFSVDGVTLADDLLVKEQRFAEIQDAAGLGMAYSLGKFDGILGMGFTSISIDNTPTVFENAIDQGILDEPVFSFYLGDNKPGELTFGGYDEEKFEGELEFVKLLSPTYWLVELDGASAGDYHSNPKPDGKPTTAIIDSGTSLIAGPKAEVNKLALAVGATPNFMGQFTIDCKKVDDLPDITFTMGGKDYSIPGKMAVIQAQGVCLFAFMGIDFGPQSPVDWILGDGKQYLDYIPLEIFKRIMPLTHMFCCSSFHAHLLYSFQLQGGNNRICESHSLGNAVKGVICLLLDAFQTSLLKTKSKVIHHLIFSLRVSTCGKSLGRILLSLLSYSYPFLYPRRRLQAHSLLPTVGQ